MRVWKGTLFLATAAMGASGGAQVISTGGAMVHVSPPPNVRANQYQHDTQIRVFEEAQGVTGADVALDITSTGLVISNAGLSPGVVTAGTTLWSYYIIFDPANGTQEATGSATFAQEVVGLIVLDNPLFASNWLGAPGTLYPTSGTLNGLELTPDTVELSADRRTVTLHARASSPGDRVRVITAAPVPEPFTLGLAGLALVAAARRRQRK